MKSIVFINTKISSSASNAPSDVNKKHINIDVSDDECDEINLIDSSFSTIS